LLVGCSIARAAMSQSRSDCLKVAVGFNPRARIKEDRPRRGATPGTALAASYVEYPPAARGSKMTMAFRNIDSKAQQAVKCSHEASPIRKLVVQHANGSFGYSKFKESAYMNLQSLIVVVLRLMALNFFLQVAIQLSPQLLRFTDLSRQGGLAGMGSYLAISLIMVIGLIAGAILIWVFALSIARFVTRGVSHDLSFGSLSLIDCYSVAFIGIGLFYIASHFSQVLNWSHYLFKAAASKPGGTWKEGVQWYDVLSAFIPFVVGVVLFVKGRSWAVALARSQQKSEFANQTLDQTGAPPASSDPQ
jgi:hypothetical protein